MFVRDNFFQHQLMNQGFLRNDCRVQILRLDVDFIPSGRSSMVNFEKYFSYDVLIENSRKMPSEILSINYIQLTSHGCFLAKLCGVLEIH